jgi:hypothetical protein
MKRTGRINSIHQTVQKSEDGMAERQRGAGRIARSTKLGGVAAGAAARAIGTKAANVVRSDEAAEEAMARQALETADQC